jgi:hypothetical protein
MEIAYFLSNVSDKLHGIGLGDRRAGGWRIILDKTGQEQIQRRKGGRCPEASAASHQKKQRKATNQMKPFPL